MTLSDPDPTEPSLAEQADPHRLYELAVQCAEAEIDFVIESLPPIIETLRALSPFWEADTGIGKVH